MKKVLLAFFFVILAGTVTGGFLVFKRFQANPEQIVPLPYEFQDSASGIKLDAPILIVGDRMGHYFAKFHTALAETISTGLNKPIKIQTLAKTGSAIHRTIHELKSISQWPQILIYQGGSEEFFENKFNESEIQKIKRNFKLYNDDRVETALILFPWLSRIVYEPLSRVKLEDSPLPNNHSEETYLKRLETELLLYEEHLTELVNMSKAKNSLLILTTTPINLDIPPRKTCDFTTTTEIEAQILELRELLKSNDPKTAYNRSSKLIAKFTGNASLYYFHGQISKRLGSIPEAISSLHQASAFDCTPWRATEVYNTILRKVANEHQVILFDFAKLVENDFGENVSFFDEIYPQNLYYEKGMQQLGLVIKSILKL